MRAERLGNNTIGIFPLKKKKKKLSTDFAQASAIVLTHNMVGKTGCLMFDLSRPIFPTLSNSFSACVGFIVDAVLNFF